MRPAATAVTRQGFLVAAAAIVVLVSSGPSSGDSSSGAISAGGEHTCALVSGGAKCWGYNEDGQLGDATIKARHSAVGVAGLSSGVEAIAAGGYHSCAIVNGDAECWGDNEYGQLGDGTNTASSSPVPVSGLASGVQAITASFHTCALLGGGGGVQCWGDNRAGQLGDGTTTNRAVPGAVSGLSSGVQAIAAGGVHTCVLLDSGGVKCWGDNEAGQLGDGTTKNRSIPVAVSGLSSGVRAITTGLGHTCALLSGGGVKCWGYNHEGELGDGTETTRLKPVAVIGLSRGVGAIAAGGEHTCAILSGGGVKCWGEFAEEPEDVSGLSSGVQAIAAGGSDVDEHSCALLNTGRIKCWGDNAYGQLGDGTTVDRDNPVSVLGLPTGVQVLTVLVRGRGTVTGSGIRCTKECGFERPQGTTLILKVQAAKGWTFKNWAGACKGRAKSCTVVLNADATVTARFAKRESRR